jgi:outer membrane protein
VVSEVYNGFDMKKEMEKKYQDTSIARKKILDSLELEIKVIQNKISEKTLIKAADTMGYNELLDEYLLKKKFFDEDNTALSKKYDEEIITKLNLYVNDFGELYHYNYIFGTGGNGSLMFADQNENLTNKLIDFINMKYKGK